MKPSKVVLIPADVEVAQPLSCRAAKTEPTPLLPTMYPMSEQGLLRYRALVSGSCHTTCTSRMSLMGFIRMSLPPPLMKIDDDPLLFPPVNLVFEGVTFDDASAAVIG